MTETAMTQLDDIKQQGQAVTEKIHEVERGLAGLRAQLDTKEGRLFTLRSFHACPICDTELQTQNMQRKAGDTQRQIEATRNVITEEQEKLQALELKRTALLERFRKLRGSMLSQPADPGNT